MIKEADLPLNQRGAVYHLNLRPEELSDTVITVGDPDRVGQVSRYFDRMDCKLEHREFVTHTGYIGSKRLSVISTGIGVDNIDIVMNELDALVNIDLVDRTPKTKTRALNIIRLGTTGGVIESCLPGDIVLSRYALGFDSMYSFYEKPKSTELEAFTQEMREHLAELNVPFYVTEASETLHQHFNTLGMSGITATCTGFYGPQGRHLRIPLARPGLVERLASFRHGDYQMTNLEMETAALYALSAMLGHSCLSISVIIANRVRGTFASDVQKCTDQMIEGALELVARI